jgi:CHASE2 domain-containing sensor protein
MDGSREIRADRTERFLVWGWVLASLSVLLPVSAIGGLIFGVIAVNRDRAGHGAGMIIVSLVGSLVFVYLASQTLVPR